MWNRKLLKSLFWLKKIPSFLETNLSNAIMCFSTSGSCMLLSSWNCAFSPIFYFKKSFRQYLSEMNLTNNIKYMYDNQEQKGWRSDVILLMFYSSHILIHIMVILIKFHTGKTSYTGIITVQYSIWLVDILRIPDFPDFIQFWNERLLWYRFNLLTSSETTMTAGSSFSFIRQRECSGASASFVCEQFTQIQENIEL